MLVDPNGMEIRSAPVFEAKIRIEAPAEARDQVVAKAKADLTAWLAMQMPLERPVTFWFTEPEVKEAAGTPNFVVYKIVMRIVAENASIWLGRQAEKAGIKKEAQ